MILTDEQYKKLVNKGVINGCGGKKGFSFSALSRKLSELEYFDDNKFIKLQNSLERYGCGPHDVLYAMGGKWYDKLFADLMLCNYVFNRTSWCNIAIRLFIYLVLLIGLYKKGGRYFKYGEKKSLEDLL